MKRFFCALVVLMVGVTSNLQASDKDAEAPKSSIRFSGIPALNFDSDSGFGGGIIGNMYIDEEGFAPYRTSLGAQVLLTTKWVQSHKLTFDHLNAFGLPLRLTGRLGFFSSINQNFCGFGAHADCDKERAKNMGKSLGLSNEKLTEFENHYYQYPFLSFYGDIFGRWLLWKGNAKLELMSSYRGRYYKNGTFSSSNLYPNSLYEREFKYKKAEGYLSTIEVGMMLDSRDNEPAPTSGFWLESSIRGGGKFVGSSWDYFGANAAARFYFALDSNAKLIVASQTIIDAIVGDLPYDAMSRLGGSQAINDMNAIGGQYIGRGIREQLYVGRFKAIEQLEFRYNFFDFAIKTQKFDMVAATFGDFGATAWNYSDFLEEMKKVQCGFGGGLRIYWNKTFVIRGDVGFSPAENFAHKIYLVVGNVF